MPWTVPAALAACAAIVALPMISKYGCPTRLGNGHRPCGKGSLYGNVNAAANPNFRRIRTS